MQPASALEVHDARTGALVWEWQPPVGPGHDSAFVAGTAYSPDGKILAGGMVWDPTSPDRFGPPSEAGAPAADGLLGIHLWDADTHEPVGHLDVGPCGGWPLEVSERYVFVRALVPSTDPASAAQSDDPVTPGCQWWRGGWGNYVVDRATGEATLLGVTSPATLQWNLGAALSDDGSVAAVLDQRRDEWAHGDRNDYNSTVLVDTVTGEEIRRIRHTEPVDLDATGEHVLLIESGVDDSNFRGSSTWRVVAVADGRTVATYAGHQGRASYGTFAPDGATVLSAGLDNVLHRWDARTGEEVRQWPSTGSGRPSAAGPRVLVPRSETAGAVLVDTRAPSEGWSVPGCGGLVFPDQLQFVEGLVVVARGCEGFPGQLEVIQPDDEDPVAVADAVWNENLAVFPAGSRVVAQEGTRETADARPVLGSLQGRDLSTGEPLVALEGFCSHPRDLHSASDCARLPAVPAAIAAWTVRWSPDGRWIAAIDGNTGLVAVWEASTGELVAGDIEVGVSAEGFAGPWEMTFTPDSTRLILTTMTAELVAVDVSTWEPVTSARFASSDHLSAAPVGFAEDGSLVVVSPLRDNVAGATLLLADPDTLEVRQTFSGVVGGRVQSAAVSPSGTRVAMATSEGFVGVWDLATGALLDQADPRLGNLSSVRWVDDDDLLVLSSGGALTTVTTDPARLLTLVRSSVTRGLTGSECTAHQIQPCPTLGDLRGGDPSVPAELRGTYAVTWTADELQAAGVEHYQTVHGADLDPAAVARLGGLARELAGDYRITFTERGYAITDGNGELWCTGAVTRPSDRPDRLLLGADRGAGCVDFHYAEIGWELDGDQLSLPRAEFRGPDTEALLWTAKSLVRVD